MGRFCCPQPFVAAAEQEEFSFPVVLALALQLRTLFLYGSINFQNLLQNLALLNLQGTVINLTEIALSRAVYFPSALPQRYRLSPVKSGAEFAASTVRGLLLLLSLCKG